MKNKSIHLGDIIEPDMLIEKQRVKYAIDKIRHAFGLILRHAAKFKIDFKLLGEM